MSKKNILSKVKVVMGDAVQCSTGLMRRVMQETVIDLSVSKVFSAEQQRVAWTNYNHMKMWFGNWESDLVALGFAH